jgi:hypothetical protein
LLLEAPERRVLSSFFQSLKAQTLAAWRSREGFAYDRVLYSVRYPYVAPDLEQVLEWAGHPQDLLRLPALEQLNRGLTGRVYPKAASLAPGGVSAEGWSAILHFLDPSYPLATPAAFEGLKELGFSLAPRLEASGYPRYLAAVDSLKERAPVAAVPETNWYLGRVIQVGLESWGKRHGAP